jgi:hypothetical protein
MLGASWVNVVDLTGKSWNHFIDILMEWNAELGVSQNQNARSPSLSP